MSKKNQKIFHLNCDLSDRLIISFENSSSARDFVKSSLRDDVLPFIRTYLNFMNNNDCCTFMRFNYDDIEIDIRKRCGCFSFPYHLVLCVNNNYCGDSL